VGLLLAAGTLHVIAEPRVPADFGTVPDVVAAAQVPAAGGAVPGAAVLAPGTAGAARGGSRTGRV